MAAAAPESCERSRSLDWSACQNSRNRIGLWHSLIHILRFNGFGAAELEWYFSCRQDLFTHVDHLCCFDLDDSATKVTITRALDHLRRMFVILQASRTNAFALLSSLMQSQMSAERAVRELDEVSN
jgi:hypothetical protein